MMSQPSELWWDAIHERLSDLLDMLDEREEPLIAAHVAMALDCVEFRQRSGDAEPS